MAGDKKFINIDKGRIEKVYLIFAPIFAPLYFSSNTEWVFDHRKAELFSSEEGAQLHIKRLQGYDGQYLRNKLSCDPEYLQIESRYICVCDHLWL